MQTLGKLLLTVLIIAGAVFAFYEKSINKVVQKETMKAEVISVAKHFHTGLNDLAPIEKVDVTPKAEGVAGELEQLIKEHYNALAEIQKEYLKELDDIDLENMLNPESWQKDAEFKQSKQMAVLARQSAEKAYARNLEAQKNHVDKFKKINIPFKENEKKAFLEGIETEQTAALAKLKQGWEMEFDILDTMEKLIDFMVGRNGRWELGEDGAVLFETDEEIEQYNALIEAMYEQIERQDEYMKKIQQETIQKMKGM